MKENIPSQIEEEEKEHIFNLVDELEEIEDDKEAREILAELFDFMIEDLGIELMPDVSSIYNEADQKGDLFRLEQLSKVVHALVDHDAIEVGSDEDRYANAVTPDGINIAFAEGEAPGPVRLLIGFDFKSAIGFDPEGLEVEDIEMSDFDLRNTRLRSAKCRHVSGKIDSERIEYIVLRSPRNLFPEDRLTEEEKDSGQRFIFRGGRVEVV